MYVITQKLIHHFILPSLRRFRSSSPASKTMNVFTQTRNPITGTTEWDIQHEDYDFHQEIARSAFADMLHDTERNQKYYRALRQAIEKMHADGKKANVLDIGTGTGLLSIMAARCGADSIVACEAFKPMAECCQKILQHNGVADKISLIPKRSTELTVGLDGDMKEKANILVTEVFDTELIGEGALPTFTHAHKHLLEKDCIVVPDSAVVYAQLVECTTMQKWNKLNDLADEELQLILRTPEKMRNCAGSASVHDIQLSQLPRNSFTELSDPIPVLRYDWSGRTALDKDRVTRDVFRATGTGRAQAVFMWWELNMDTEGKILLSCAPWWSHPDADTQTPRPQDTIPWRDHWMQAVYYLPQETTLNKGSDATLISCQDEYSLWFYLENQELKCKGYERPICECGVHIAFSRTHVSYINDGKRSKKFLAQLREEIDSNSVVLDLNGSSLMGLSAAKLGAKTVYIMESMNVTVNVLKDYAKENGIENVRFVSEVDEGILGNVTHVTCDPNFTSAILPWENLKMAYLLHKYESQLKSLKCVIPEAFELWAMPVEFQDLQKIRIPLDRCEGVDMAIFDDLVERSRTISDTELEAQPLWEYPCRCRGEPQRLLQVDLNSLQATYANDGSHAAVESPDETRTINGFAVWASWSVGGKPVSCGPVAWPTVDERVQWDPHTRQGVKILQRSCEVTDADRWSYQVACDLSKGQFDIAIDLNRPE